MNRATAAGVARAEQSQNQSPGAAHEKQQGAGEGKKRLHGSGDGECNLFSSLQGQSFRDEFAEQNVEVGDQAERDDDGNAVGVDGGVGNLLNEAEGTNQLGNHGFADPAQGEADHGDAELHAVHDFV